MHVLVSDSELSSLAAPSAMDTDIGRPGAGMLACIRISKSSPCLRVFPHILFPLYRSRPALSHQQGRLPEMRGLCLQDGKSSTPMQLVRRKISAFSHAYRSCVSVLVLPTVHLARYFCVSDYDDLDARALALLQG